MKTVIPLMHNADGEVNKQLGSFDLLVQRNSRLPIFRLLPEILTLIFINGARAHHEKIRNDDLRRSSFRRPDWVNVSYVCRHWRNIALNCPILWTYHFIVSLRWTEELLARSKQASLKILVHIDLTQKDRSWWSDLVAKLLVHLGRIQELRLDGPSIAFPSTLSLLAPRLQMLDIQPYSHRPGWSLTISDGDVPPLRTLRLVECWLPWHTFNLSGVTTLSLCLVPAPEYNIAEVLATLPRMPFLTALHLERALASARDYLSSEAFIALPKINLPFLSRLSLAAPLSTAIALLSCINPPLEAELRLEFQWERGTSIYDYDQIPLVLTRRFSHFKDLLPFRSPIRSLAIRSPYQSTFTLCLSELDDPNPYISLEYPGWDSNHPLVIIVQMEHGLNRSNWHHVVSDICCSIPLPDLHTLHVIDPPFSSDFWEKTLGHLHGLRYLTLCEGNMPNLSHLLAFPADDTMETSNGYDHGTAVGQTFVPALEFLELEYITFMSEDDASRGGVTERSLLAALDTRKALRPRLRMSNCGVHDFESDDDGSVLLDE